MKLYVCYGTWKRALRPGVHPCGVAYEALKQAGYDLHPATAGHAEATPT